MAIRLDITELDHYWGIFLLQIDMKDFSRNEDEDKKN